MSNKRLLGMKNTVKWYEDLFRLFFIFYSLVFKFSEVLTSLQIIEGKQIKANSTKSKKSRYIVWIKNKNQPLESAYALLSSYQDRTSFLINRLSDSCLQKFDCLLWFESDFIYYRLLVVRKKKANHEWNVQDVFLLTADFKISRKSSTTYEFYKGATSIFNFETSESENMSSIIRALQNAQKSSRTNFI